MNRARIFNFVSIISLSILTVLAACAAAPKEVQPDSAAAPAASSAVGSVRWTAPARWETKPAGGMRAATYIIPAAEGDSEGGECAVFVNLGGGVEANIKRWIGQFEKTDSEPKRKSEKINDLPVTIVDVSGTYKGGGPMIGQPAMSKAGYRLLGAIVEGPEGDIFFKLTGPAKTVTSAENEFLEMLKSLKK
ncbi:MAG TPA: hypothetical protein VIM99_14675 [Blastocatellia bacterium]